MVRRILKVLYKESSSLHQAAFLLGLSAFASQLLALLRDRLLAHNFGAGTDLDVYYIAFRIPDLLYVSIASFVSVTVLIPFIVNRLGEDKRLDLSRFLNSVLTIFSIVMIIVSVVLFLLMPVLIKLIAPGFSALEKELLIYLSRILLLSPFLLGLSNLAGSVNQAFNRFFIYTLSPIFYNFGIIIGILFFLPSYGLVGLVWGVVLGALLHLLIQLPSIYNMGFWPRLNFNPDWSLIRQVALISLPRTIALSAHQLVVLVLLALGSFLVSGSVAIFNFALNLQSVPLVIIGVSYSVAAFPTLSKFLQTGDLLKFRQQVSIVVRHILFWSLPAVALFVVLRAQIVRIILGSGKFGWTDTRLTAAALALFVFSVTAQSLINLFVRSYYAGGKTKKPLLINIFSAVLIIILAVTFLKLFTVVPVFKFLIEILFRVEDLEGTAVLMLPLAFSLGTIVNALLLWFYFQKDFGQFVPGVLTTLLNSISTALFSAYVAYIALVFFADIFNLNTFWGIFAQGLLAAILAVLAGVLMLLTLGSQELKEFITSFTFRFGRVKPIAPDPEEL